jgi:hypothetical protein
MIQAEPKDATEKEDKMPSDQICSCQALTSPPNRGKSIVTLAYGRRSLTLAEPGAKRANCEAAGTR